jgi:hypothetical protein
MARKESSKMAQPSSLKEIVNERTSSRALVERDRIELARVGKKEVLKVSCR